MLGTWASNLSVIVWAGEGRYNSLTSFFYPPLSYLTIQDTKHKLSSPNH